MTEVKKLRALLAEARREHDGDANIGACGTDNDGNDTRCDRCQRIDVALAEPVVDDYKRGAEAMREAAAKAANGHAVLPRDTPTDIAWCRAAMCIEERIRTLPVPEDEP